MVDSYLLVVLVLALAPAVLREVAKVLRSMHPDTFVRGRWPGSVVEAGRGPGVGAGELRVVGPELVARRCLGAAASVHGGAAALGVHQVEGVAAGELPGLGCDVPHAEESTVPRGRRAGGAVPRSSASTSPRGVSPRSGAAGRDGKGRRR